MDYVLSVYVFECVVKKNVLMLIEDMNDVQTLTNIDATTESSCAVPFFRNVNLMMQTKTSVAHEIIKSIMTMEYDMSKNSGKRTGTFNH